MERGLAVVTGASSGIGAATATRLAAEGFSVLLGARREDRLAEVAAGLPGSHVYAVDVTDTPSVDAFAAHAASLGGARVVVCNAGGALGLDPVEAADDEQWRWMYDANVLGTMRTVRAFLPQFGAATPEAPAHVVTMGSIAGLEVYDNGGGYTAAKHGLAAVTDTLRLELMGRPIRVTEIDPGLVETEFSLVRFSGDQEAARKPYVGMTPLVADDIADAVAWAVTRPAHVNIDRMVIKPVAQATAMRVARKP